jgi:hypothetical protein
MVRKKILKFYQIGLYYQIWHEVLANGQYYLPNNTVLESIGSVSINFFKSRIHQSSAIVQISQCML